MKVTATIVFVYGLLVLIGGIIGYKTAGSPMSLIAGILSGLPLIGAGIAVAKGNLTGLYVALAMTFALDGFFTYRFAKTLSFMPAGLMSLLSLLVLIITALKIRKTAKE
jgi:uncharacterized membrane protein (UPF0136 family)